MTDPDSILQLGIEAARDGNKEEARNLFRLLIGEDSQNVQAWLWLAGVSESLDERRTALERVLELDPDNDMALKSKQALEGESQPPKGPAPVIRPSPPPPSAGGDDFDDPFAELDALSGLMEDADAKSPAKATSSSPSPSVTSAKSSQTTSKSATEPMPRSTFSKGRDSIAQKPSASSSFGSKKEKGSEKRMSKPSVSSGVNLRVIALALAVFVVILGLVFVVWPRFFSKKQQVVQTVPPPTVVVQPTIPIEGVPIANATQVGTGVETVASVEALNATPETPQLASSPVGPPNASSQPSLATTGNNITIVPPNNPMEVNGWLYDFNQNVCAPNSCATVWPTMISAFQPKGRFVVLVVMVVNRTGQSQPVPADLLVLRDSQGRFYNALPQVSEAYVTPGVNADQSHVNPIPSNGIATSVAVVFDVDVGATDLVLVSPAKSDQGWKVVDRVQ